MACKDHILIWVLRQNAIRRAAHPRHDHRPTFPVGRADVFPSLPKGARKFRIRLANRIKPLPLPFAKMKFAQMRLMRQAQARR